MDINSDHIFCQVGTAANCTCQMVTRSDSTNTFRCPRKNQITCSKLLILWNICDHSGNIEDHFVRVWLLASLTINLKLNLDIAAILNGTFVNELWNRTEFIRSLGQTPIWTRALVLVLHDSIGEVDTDEVAGYVSERILRLYIASVHSNNQAHLNFVMYILMNSFLES